MERKETETILKDLSTQSGRDVAQTIHPIINRSKNKNISEIALLFTNTHPLYHLIQTLVAYRNQQISKYEKSRACISLLTDSHEDMMKYCYQLEQDGYLSRQEINQALFCTDGILISAIEKIPWLQYNKDLTHFMRNRSDILSAREDIQQYLLHNILSASNKTDLKIYPYDIWVNLSSFPTEERAALIEKALLIEKNIEENSTLSCTLKWLKQPTAALASSPEQNPIHSSVPFFLQFPPNIRTKIYDYLPDRDARSVFTTCKSLYFEGRKSSTWRSRLATHIQDDSLLYEAYLLKDEKGRPLINNWQALYRSCILLPQSLLDDITQVWQLACLSGSIQAFRGLPLDNTRLESEMGCLPTHYVALSGNMSFYRILVYEFKIPAMRCNNNGANELHYAASAGYTDFLKTLVAEFDCNIKQTDNNRRNAYDYSYNNNNRHTLNYLRDQGLTLTHAVASHNNNCRIL